MSEYIVTVPKRHFIPAVVLNSRYDTTLFTQVDDNMTVINDHDTWKTTL